MSPQNRNAGAGPRGHGRSARRGRGGDRGRAVRATATRRIEINPSDLQDIAQKSEQQRTVLLEESFGLKEVPHINSPAEGKAVLVNVENEFNNYHRIYITLSLPKKPNLSEEYETVTPVEDVFEKWREHYQRQLDIVAEFYNGPAEAPNLSNEEFCQKADLKDCWEMSERLVGVAPVTHLGIEYTIAFRFTQRYFRPYVPDLKIYWTLWTPKESEAEAASPKAGVPSSLASKFFPRVAHYKAIVTKSARRMLGLNN